MRAAAQESYQLGIDYVTSKKKTVGFLTSMDLETIRQQVQKYVIRFWRKVDMVIHRNDVLLQTRNYEPRSELNSNYMATVIAVALVTTTLALATKTKAIILSSSVKSAAIQKKLPKCPKGKHWDVKLKKCVDDETPTPSALPFSPEPLDYLSPALATIGFALRETDEGDIETEDIETEQMIVIWNAILDNRTCNVCEALDGTEWLPDDPDLPIPGDEGDIHDNCRCLWDVDIRSTF